MGLGNQVRKIGEKIDRVENSVASKWQKIGDQVRKKINDTKKLMLQKLISELERSESWPSLILDRHTDTDSITQEDMAQIRMPEEENFENQTRINQSNRFDSEEILLISTIESQQGKSALHMLADFQRMRFLDKDYAYKSCVMKDAEDDDCPICMEPMERMQVIWSVIFIRFIVR